MIDKVIDHHGNLKYDGEGSPCGAAWFESQLIDFDPASNYGNWLYIAGRGNDPRPFRKFNTKMQLERYDPENSYVNTWLN